MDNKVQELTKTIYEQKDQINHLSTTTEKAVQTASGFDELKNQIEEREAKLREIESRVAAVASGTTGMFLDIPTIVNYIKDRIDAANRSFRLCVPTVDFLEENGLQDLLLAIDQKCAVNVAMALDMAQHEELINNWKEHHFNVVDFWEKNLITVSANGADVGFAFVQGESISGFYTNIPELVTIFNQAITYPFMKGKRSNFFIIIMEKLSFNNGSHNSGKNWLRLSLLVLHRLNKT